MAIPVWRCVNVFMDIAMWGHCTVFLTEIFKQGEVYCVKSIIITNLFTLSFSVVKLKMSFLHTLALNSNRIVVWHLRNLLNTSSSSQWKLPFIHSVLSSVGAWTQNNDTKPATSQYYVWHPVTNKRNPPHCWYGSLMLKNLYPIHDSEPFFHRNVYCAN
jgi:hypothetical protein